MTDLLGGDLAFRDGSDGEDDLGRAALGDLLCGMETEADVRAGDNDGLAGEGEFGVESGGGGSLRVECGWEGAGSGHGLFCGMVVRVSGGDCEVKTWSVCEGVSEGMGV